MGKRLIRNIFLLLSTVFIAIWSTQSFAPGKNPTASFKSFIPCYIQDSIYLSPDNPFDEQKAATGHYLFYDRRISFNKTKSCASCHDPAFSFSDGYRRSIGATGDNVQHNAPALINIVFLKYLTAADSSIHYPEQQINNPFFHNHPVELGWKGNESFILKRLEQDSFYAKNMSAAFAGEQPVFTIKHLQQCITSFIKTIVSFDAPYDRYIQKGDSNAMTYAARNGMKLFFSDSLACAKCHGGSGFATPLVKDSSDRQLFYFNTGLYNINGTGGYPSADQGLIELTKRKGDMGKFRVPTLRNLAFTAPYFHDGSAATLEDVVALYENAGRVIQTGPLAGDGRINPIKHPLIKGFRLSLQQRSDLVHFLLSLSDTTVCNNPLYTNPFIGDETKK